MLELLDLPADDKARDLALSAPARLKRSGRALRLVHDGGVVASRQIDPSLVRMVARAHYWWRILRTQQINIKTLASREMVTASWMTRVLRLAFLSPAFTEAILTGRQKADLDGATLLAWGANDAVWAAQEAKFLARPG